MLKKYFLPVIYIYPKKKMGVIPTKIAKDIAKTGDPNTKIKTQTQPVNLPGLRPVDNDLTPDPIETHGPNDIRNDAVLRIDNDSRLGVVINWIKPDGVLASSELIEGRTKKEYKTQKHHSFLIRVPKIHVNEVVYGGDGNVKITDILTRQRKQHNTFWYN